MSNFANINIQKLAARFWDKVLIVKNQSCWIWQCSTNPNGYGHFKVGRKTVLAHRVAYFLFYCVELPSTTLVRHRCDNPPCCNPFHLLNGSHLDNARDMIERGRIYNRNGEKNPRATLSKQDVIHIRKLYNAGGYSQIALAKQYGVARSTIQAITANKIWKEVNNEQSIY